MDDVNSLVEVKHSYINPPPITWKPLNLSFRSVEVYGREHGKIVRETYFPSELVASEEFREMHIIVAE